MLQQGRLGTGPLVSELCLGTMMFGDQTGEDEAREIVARFAAAGGTFVDTADSYAGGESERILGRLIATDRSRWFLATKVGNPVGGRAGTGGLSARWIRQALRDSLDRLGTDRIDLYYLHRDDETTSLDEMIAGMGEAMADGRIGAWGFSNFKPWKIADMIRISDRLGVARPLAGQPYYHALYRIAETDYLPACRHFGIGVVPYSPLARGVLTGKYRDGLPPGSRAARGDKRITETEMRPDLLAAARRVDDHARASGRSTSDLALRWVLENRAVSSVLVGPRTAGQLDGYLRGPACRFDGEDERFFDALLPPGCVVGGYSDPAYPVRGRFIGTI